MPTHNKTVISAFQAFASGTDLVNYRDWRHVADLLNDDDTRVGSSAAVQSHALVLLALKTASAQIEVACYRGGRYTRDDLAALVDTVTAVDPTTGTLTTAYTVSRELLRKLTCDLAFWFLVTRRKPDASPRVISGVAEAMNMLEMLKLGEEVFPFQEVVDASVMDIAPLDPTKSKTTVNTTPLTTLASRLFGNRPRAT
jgi:hypothetical protein